MDRYRGSQFYDEEHTFKNYLERRNWNENANDTIEKPIFMELLGDISGKHILDLGCGNAAFGNELLDLGCLTYTGLEGSSKMYNLAKETLNKDNGQVIHCTMEEWDYPDSVYQLVASRLALHYIKNIEEIFHNVYKSLVNGGTFIFSVEHPVMTSSYGMVRSEGAKTNWIVDHYFYTGPREQEWLGGKVIKYHRTIEDYYHALQKAGFKIQCLRESKPKREHFIHQETFERRMRIPLFLFMAAMKDEPLGGIGMTTDNRTVNGKLIKS